MPDDETNSASSTEKAKESDNRTSAQGLIQKQERSEGEQESGGEEEHSDDAPKPIFPVRMWRWLGKWWNDPYRPRGNFAEHLTVVVSIVIAVIAGFQWSVYRQQKQIMQSSSGQTSQLIVAANIQAGAATNIAGSAGQFTTSANEMKDQAKIAVSEIKTAEQDFRQMANAADRSVQQNVKEAEIALNQSRLEQRAWIAVGHLDLISMEPNAMASFLIWVTNTGKTPARNVRACNYTRVPINNAEDIPPFDDDCTDNMAHDSHFAVLTWVMPNGNAATGAKTIVLSQTQIEMVRAGIKPVFVYGKIWYDDIYNRHHWVRYCSRYDVPSKNTLACDGHNDTDTDN